jgi:hypothetical protein
LTLATEKALVWSMAGTRGLPWRTEWEFWFVCLGQVLPSVIGD